MFACSVNVCYHAGMSALTIAVDDIKSGDTFHDNPDASGSGWTAIEDAETFMNGEVSVRVQYNPDGGIGDRIWDNADVTLTVFR